MMMDEISDDIDGFILQDGEFVSIKDADRMFSLLIRGNESPAAVTRSLHVLARECLDKGHCRAAFNYFEKILSLTEDPDESALCCLRMGQIMEQAADYRAALDSYLRPFELPQKPNEVWYFLNNNAGYCLNQAGRHSEAAEYCRAAIKIDPNRHNAHKNLGISLQHQGRYADAARCFIRATRLCPADGRAAGHLEDLIAGHRELLMEVPDLLEQAHKCWQLLRANKKKFRVQ